MIFVQEILFLNVRLFEAITILFVDGFEIDGYQECNDTEGGEDDQRNGVVVGDEGVGGTSGDGFFGGDDSLVVGVAALQYAANEHGHEAESNVLYPEDERVGTAEIAGIHHFWHRGPQGCGD